MGGNRMATKESSNHAFPLLNGIYKATDTWYIALIINGSKGIVKDSSGKNLEATIKVGEFEAADPEVVEKTGQTINNIEISYDFGQTLIEPGVVSADGLTIVTKNLMGVNVLTWVTEEELAELEAQGDPIEAPPGPYKIQPEYQGKLL